MLNEDDEAAADDRPSPVQGGRERGLVIHKLLEEALNRETPDAADCLSARAAELNDDLGKEAVMDAAVGLAPAECAGCVLRALALPEIAALRPTFVPELPVFALGDRRGNRDRDGGHRRRNELRQGR